MTDRRGPTEGGRRKGVAHPAGQKENDNENANKSLQREVEDSSARQSADMEAANGPEEQEEDRGSQRAHHRPPQGACPSVVTAAGLRE